MDVVREDKAHADDACNEDARQTDTATSCEARSPREQLIWAPFSTSKASSDQIGFGMAEPSAATTCLLVTIARLPKLKVEDGVETVPRKYRCSGLACASRARVTARELSKHHLKLFNVERGDSQSSLISYKLAHSNCSL